MIFLLLLCVVSLTALADDVTVIPRNGSGKMPANGDEVTLEGPNVDFSHVPPNLAFTLRNDSATSFEMSVTVDVYWNSSPKCPGRYAKTWTGTMLGGATEIKIYDADLDQYAFSVGPTMCEATSFGAKAEVTKSWPSWLNDCDGLLWHTLPDGSSPRENRHWRQSWLDLVASDSHTDSK